MASNPALGPQFEPPGALPTIEIMLYVKEINEARVAGGLARMTAQEIREFARDVFTFRRVTGH